MVWSSRLPHIVQTIVATHSETTVAKTAEIADKVYELAPLSPLVAAATTSDVPLYMPEMAKQIAELTKCVAELSTGEGRLIEVNRSLATAARRRGDRHQASACAGITGSSATKHKNVPTLAA